MEGGDQETAADLARLLDSDAESEQPDPAAARAAIVPYLGDIDRYMRSLEALRRPKDDYMWTTQKDIRPNMRAVLVDWLVEVAQDFGLPSDTLHLAVSYVDRFLSATVISRDKLQLLGVAALLVAAKYEDDIFLHEVEKYTEVTDNTYTRQQVVKMETDILKFLNYEMGSPTARTFLQRYITACHGGDQAKAKKLEFLCSYLADLGSLDYNCIRFNPSVVAAACLFVASFTISPTTRPWNLAPQRNTDYKVSDLKSCILLIHGLQLNGTYPGLKEEANKVMYNDGEFERVGNGSTSTNPCVFPQGHRTVERPKCSCNNFCSRCRNYKFFYEQTTGVLQFLSASSYPRLPGCCRISLHVAVLVALIAAWLAALIG